MKITEKTILISQIKMNTSRHIIITDCPEIKVSEPSSKSHSKTE